MKVKYQHNTRRNKAEIILIDDHDTCLVMTVVEAAALVADLSRAMQEAFYDFTASTPNRGSAADARRQEKDNA